MENKKAELLLTKLNEAPPGLCVEIGCIREDHEVLEDGYSTYYLARHCKTYDRIFVSYDIEQKCVDIANDMLERYMLNPIVKKADGKIALKQSGPIAFLFLDSHRHPSFSLEQYREAELVPGAILIVDDAQPIDDHEFGKAQFIKEIFDHNNIPYEIVDTANNKNYQWRSLVAVIKNGKKAGKIK
jgi:predicted O-methyltransferase YrrM